MGDYKFGALPRIHSLAAPTLEAYLTKPGDFGNDPLPNAPSVVDRLSQVETIPMYMNDQLGCCTIAAIFHAIESLEVYAGREPDGGIFSDDEVVKAYSAVSGYDPATGANDNGATLQAVCQYMTKTGAVDKNGRVHKLAAWAEVGDYTNLKLLKRVLNAFGTVYLAIEVPESAMEQFENGQPWTEVPDSPIEGGHAIPLQFSSVNTGAFDDETIETWGAKQKMNEAFAKAYLSEAVAIVIADEVNAKTGENPAGLNLQQLIADCQEKYLV